MLACEATAHSFLARNGLLEATTFFRIESLEARLKGHDPGTRQRILTECDLGREYLLLKNVSQLQEFVPLYWGDFLHMNPYQNALRLSWSENKADVRRLLLLEGAPESTKRRTISYATSILFNGTEDYRNPEYGPALLHFIQSAHHIQMRDAISAARVAGMRHSQRSVFGLDAAQLLALPECAKYLLGEALDCERRPRALLFFGRGLHDWTLTKPFIHRLVQTLDLQPEWFPWGDVMSFPYMDTAWKELPVTTLAGLGKSHHLNKLLHVLRSSTLVVTDTYHLAAISWALGVPAVVVAGGYHPREITAKSLDLRVRHDKRKILLAQDGLLDYFIEPYLLSATGRWRDVADRLALLLRDPRMVIDARKMLASRAQVSEDSLLAAIQSARFGMTE